MALVPLATKGHYFHVYDFKVKPGRGDEFVELFNKFDYGDNNPFHRSAAQVKDGVLCRDTENPDHFYLIGEWRDIEEHRRIREFVAREIRPEFVQLIEGGHFVPNYAEIVSMTPQEEEARREGLSPEIIETIRHRRDTSGLDDADAAVIELGREVFTARKVKSETFARALELFGRKKLVDLVALMGNYAATAAMLTAFDMQLDPDQPPPLPARS